jgi:hypothetical protein
MSSPRICQMTKMTSVDCDIEKDLTIARRKLRASRGDTTGSKNNVTFDSSLSKVREPFRTDVREYKGQCNTWQWISTATRQLLIQLMSSSMQ